MTDKAPKNFKKILELAYSQVPPQEPDTYDAPEYRALADVMFSYVRDADTPEPFANPCQLRLLEDVVDDAIRVVHEEGAPFYMALPPLVHAVTHHHAKTETDVYNASTFLADAMRNLLLAEMFDTTGTRHDLKKP